MFAGAAGGDYLLSPGSPCIDAGSALGLTTDLAGMPRPLDGNGDGNSRPDMGAHEFISGSSDSDQDGATDGNELIAGTDLLNAASYFQIDRILHNADQTIVTWSSALGRRYTVWTAYSLHDGTTWTPVRSNIEASPPINMLTNPPMTGRWQYYRIEVDHP
jgi:hypothetical protein